MLQVDLLSNPALVRKRKIFFNELLFVMSLAEQKIRRRVTRF